jgi:hypothetical protein
MTLIPVFCLSPSAARTAGFCVRALRLPDIVVRAGDRYSDAEHTFAADMQAFENEG